MKRQKKTEVMKRDTVEMAIKTEKDAESGTKRSGQARLVYVQRQKLSKDINCPKTLTVKRHKRQHPQPRDG